MPVTQADRELIHEIARRRGQDEESGREFAAAVFEARKRAGTDRYCVTDRLTGEHLYCVGGCGKELLAKSHESTRRGVKKTSDLMNPDLPRLMADLRASDLTALAKRMQEPGETVEAALCRALASPAGAELYEERRDWLRKDVPVKRTSRDEGIQKAWDARRAASNAIEEKAAKAFPSLSKPEAVVAFLQTGKGAEAYERHRAVR